MKKIPILTLRACIVQVCVLETDVAKTGSNAQNAAIGAMKSVRVQTTEKYFIDFSATLNKYSVRLP